jgi:hypothetical protein
LFFIDTEENDDWSYRSHSGASQEEIKRAMQVLLEVARLEVE